MTDPKALAKRLRRNWSNADILRAADMLDPKETSDMTTITDAHRAEARRNPPAFPQSLSAEGPFGGMTLRDWFAGQALAGLLTQGKWKTEQLARQSYCAADAMLAERGKA